jgi:hypothetical protein
MRAFPDKGHGLKLGIADATEADAADGPARTTA